MDAVATKTVTALHGCFLIPSLGSLRITREWAAVQEAVAAPRFHHQWAPDLLFLEPGFPLDVHRNLAARGHALKEQGGFSSVQVVQRREDGSMEGGADPRKGGWPAATR